MSVRAVVSGDNKGLKKLLTSLGRESTILRAKYGD